MRIPSARRDTAPGPSALLFDMGGVLLEMGNRVGMPRGELDRAGRARLLERIAEAGGRATEELLETTLFAPWRRQYLERYERGREAPWEPHLARLREVSGALRIPEAEWLESWFRPYGDSLYPVAGAAEVVAGLARRHALAVVSNVPLPGALYRRVLARHGLETPFQALFFSYDICSRKPSPLMLQKALEVLGCSPRNAVMIGDRRSSDVAAGRAAGVATVWLRSDRADGPRPDATIERLEQLPGVLAELGCPSGRSSYNAVESESAANT